MPPAEAQDKRSIAGRLPLWTVALALVLVGLALFGDKGVLRALQYRRQKAELEQQLERLEQANAALRQEIEALRSDRRTLEHIARKELGMVRQDELVFQFSAPKPPAAPAPPPAAAAPSSPAADPNR